jgi:hypothetical protein
MGKKNKKSDYMFNTIVTLTPASISIMIDIVKGCSYSFRSRSLNFVYLSKYRNKAFLENRGYLR